MSPRKDTARKKAARRERDAASVRRELQVDLRNVRRIEDALERHYYRTGAFSPYERLASDLTKASRSLETCVTLWGPDWCEPGESIQSSEKLVGAYDRQRRRLHRLMAELPPALFVGVPLQDVMFDVEEEVEEMGRDVAPATDLESALLRLPTPALRFMRSRYEIRGHRARDRIAARIADIVHRQDAFEYFAKRLSPDLLRPLARFVLEGCVSFSELSMEEPQHLSIPDDWTQPAPGIGGALRQTGLLFLARSGDDGLVYVPEEARAPMALVLEARMREQGTTSDRDLASALWACAEPERERQAKEAVACAGVHDVSWQIPTRLARLRRRTPGPDRVAEIEIRSEDERRPVTRRILISYQRTVGALRTVLQLSLMLPVRGGGVFADADDDLPLCSWRSPDEEYFGTGNRDEWATSIRDALASDGPALRYVPGPGGLPRHRVRLVALHAPERIATEPYILGGVGLRSKRIYDAPFREHGMSLEASLAAANLLLQRL